MTKILAIILTTTISLGCTDTIDDTADSTGGADTSTPATSEQTTAVISTVSSDYSTGSFATIDLSDWTVTDEIFITSGDPVVVSDENHVFQINRFGVDSVRLFEAGDWSQPNWEISTGDLSNPYTARTCAGQVFVALYGTDFIGVYDSDNGNLVGSIDLSAYADDDSVSPEAASLVEIDNVIYVGLQRLNMSMDWPTSQGSQVIEIDCETMSITNDWSIGGNITLHHWQDGEGLLVATEAYDDDVAGIYGLNPDDDTITLLAEFPDHAVNAIAAIGQHAIATSTATDYSHSGLHCIDMTSGDVTTLQSGHYFTSAQASNQGEAWIGASWPWIDPKAGTGIYVYDIASCTDLTQGDPITLSLAPTTIALY